MSKPFTIVKIGGCNGSGKTSLMRAVMAHMGVTPVPSNKYLNRGEYSSAHQEVLGSYANVCGGMDTIGDKNTRYNMVLRAAKPDTVVWFEGLITGKTYGAFGELSETPKHKGRWIYVFMDTPFDTCVERVLARRAAKGNDAPFDPERTMRPTFKACESVARRAKEAGHMVWMVNHTHSPAVAAKRLVGKVMEFHNAS